MGQTEDDGEAITLGILRELREMAEEISRGHMEYAGRFHRVLESLKNPNLADVANGLQYSVRSYERGTRQLTRVIAVCGNPTIARAAFECACKLFPNERWTLCWSGYVMDESERLPLGE
jgi:hypothetical protein